MEFLELICGMFKINKEGLLANLARLFTGEILSSAVSLFTTSILAKYLITEEFGALFSVQIFIAISSRIFNFQSWQALIKFITPHVLSDRLEIVNYYLKLGYVTDLLTALLAWISVYLMVDQIGPLLSWEENTIKLARIYSFSILFNVTGVAHCLLRYHKRFTLLARHMFCVVTIRMIFVILIIKYDLGLSAVFLAWMLSEVLSYLTLNIIALNQFSDFTLSKMLSANRRPIRKELLQFYRFLGISNLHATVRLLTLDIDILICTKFFGLVAVAQIKIAKQLASLIRKISNPLITIVYPDFVSLSKSNLLKLNHKLLRITRITLLFSTLFSVATYFLEEFVITLYTNKIYYVPYLLFLYVLANVVSLSSAGYPLFLQAIGKPGSALMSIVIATLIYFISLYFGILKMGILAVPLSLLVFFLVYWLLVSRVKKRSYERSFV